MLVHPILKDIHLKTIKEDDPYYRQKYNYLVQHGLFSESQSIEFGDLTEAMIKESLIQTPQITFETTDYCNLNCTYCSFGDLYEGFDERNHKNIDIHSAEILLKYIFEYRSKNRKRKLLIGFYGGEPLFNGEFIKKIVQIVNTLNSEGKIVVEYNLTTNALLVHKYIDFLVENKFKLLISLDGNEKNHSYRIMRKNGENSFQKVIENVDKIQCAYPDYFSKYVRFNAVLHDRNSVEDIHRFIYERYHKVPRIASLVLVDVNVNKKDILHKMYRNKFNSELDFQKDNSELLPAVHSELSLYKELTDFLKYFSLNYYVANITSLLYDIEKYLPTSTCLPGQKKILLTTHNKLLPCERVNYKYAVGEIKEEKIILDIPQITKQYKFYYDHIREICQNCYLNRFCNSCMLQLNNLDRIDKKDFVCDHYCSAKNQEKRLFHIFSFLEKYPADFSEIIEKLVIV